MEDGKSPSNRAWGGKEGKNGGGKGNILRSYSSHRGHQHYGDSGVQVSHGDHDWL